MAGLNLKLKLIDFKRVKKTYEKSPKTIMLSIANVIDLNLAIAEVEAKANVKRDLSKYDPPERKVRKGRLKDSIKAIKSKVKGPLLEASLKSGKKNAIPHAKILEEGSSVFSLNVTKKMRGFFMFKYMQSGKTDKKWLAMALSMRIFKDAEDTKPRPYLQPAFDRMVPTLLSKAQAKVDLLKI